MGLMQRKKRSNFIIRYTGSIAIGFLIVSGGTAQADNALQFEKAVHYEGKGDQIAQSIRFCNGQLYLAGSSSETNLRGLGLCYTVPPGNHPLRHLLWQSQPGLLSSDLFMEVTATSTNLFFAGQSNSIKEKCSFPVVAKFSLDQDKRDAENPLWVASDQPLKSTDQSGAYSSIVAVPEQGSSFLYAAGYISRSEINRTAVLSKFDEGGKLLWSKPLSEETDLNRAAAMRVVSSDGAVYAAGYTGSAKKAKDFNKISPDLTLWKYDSSGSSVWVKKNASFNVYLSADELKEAQMSLLASGQELYVLITQKKGSKAQVLLLQYDANGNQGWEANWNAETREGTTSMSFASDLTSGKDRLYVSGWTTYADKQTKKVDEDVFILEIDKRYGFLLASHHYGDADKNERALGIQTDDTNVYVAGYQDSAADKKNASKKDLLVLNYKILAPVKVSIDIEPDVAGKKIKAKNNQIIVAIFSDENFNAVKEIDTKSLTFGPTGNEPTWASCGMKDINNDGRLDLYCYFKDKFQSQKTNKDLFTGHDAQGILKGNMISGTPIMGTDVIELDAPVPTETAPSEPTPAPVPLVSVIPPEASPSPNPLPEPSLSLEPSPLPSPSPSPEPSLSPSPSTIETLPISSTASPAPTPSPSPLTDSGAGTETTAPQSEATTPPIAIESSVPSVSPSTISIPSNTTETATAASETSATPAVTATTQAPQFIPVVIGHPTTPAATASSTSTNVSVSGASKSVNPQSSAAAQLISSATAPQVLVSRETANDQASTETPGVESSANVEPSSGPGSGLAQAYNDLGRQELQAGKIDNAIQAFKEALHLEPKSFDAYKYLGLAYTKVGQLKAAKDAYHKALALKPKDADILKALVDLEKT